MKEIDIFPKCNTLDDVIKMLEEYEANGEHVSCEFNGVRLESENLTPDKAYMAVTGMNEADYKANLEEKLKKFEEERKQKEEIAKEKAKARIPEFMERGMGVVYPEKLSDWIEFVDKQYLSYYGDLLGAALDIMEPLEKGCSIEEAKKILRDQDHSGFSESATLKTILHFSKRGPEFVESVLDKPLKPEITEGLNRIKEENARLEKLHLDDAPKHL